MTAPDLNDLRRRVLENQPVTEAELAEAIRVRFGERVRQLEKPATKGKTTKVLNLDDLLPGT